jgi:hypothetical protein
MDLTSPQLFHIFPGDLISFNNLWIQDRKRWPNVNGLTASFHSPPRSQFKS